MTDLNVLIERLKAATGADRILDALLDIAFERGRPAWAHDTGTLTVDGRWVRLSPTGAGWSPPQYTSVTDSALTLRGGLSWATGDCNEDNQPWACLTDHDGNDYAATGSTPAIALCIAALSARSRTARGKSGAEDHSIQKAVIDTEQPVTKPSPATGGAT